MKFSPEMDKEVSEINFRHLLLKTIFLDFGLTGCDLVTDLIQAGVQNIFEQ